MADFAHKAATTDSTYLATIEEYDLYCYYVAGPVGEGLSRLQSASSKEVDWLEYQLELSNCMGLLPQKNNIIYDYRASWAQGGMILDILRHATDALDYPPFIEEGYVPTEY